MSDNFFSEFEEKQKAAAAKAAENKRKANEAAAAAKAAKDAAAAEKKRKANEAAAAKAAKEAEKAEKEAAKRVRKAVEITGKAPVPTKATTVSAGPLGAGPAPSPGKAEPAPSPGKAVPAVTTTTTAAVVAAPEEPNGCPPYTKETETIGIHKILYPLNAEDATEVDRIAGSFPGGTLPVHGESNCFLNFTKLSIFLNRFIASPTDTPQQLQQKYMSIRDQVRNCIASRVADRAKVLAIPTRHKATDAVHNGRIQQVYALFEKLEEMNTEGNFHRITNICFKYTNSEVGKQGYFQITYNKPPPPPPKNYGVSATTEKANGAEASAPTGTNAWTGGKRKTRKARKSTRKQTRRRR